MTDQTTYQIRRVIEYREFFKGEKPIDILATLKLYNRNTLVRMAAILSLHYGNMYVPDNEARCDFSETRFGDLTPPGTLVTEDMTAQDIERMREDRRRSNNSGTPKYSVTQQSSGQGYVLNKHYRR